MPFDPETGLYHFPDVNLQGIIADVHGAYLLGFDASKRLESEYLQAHKRCRKEASRSVGNDVRAQSGCIVLKVECKKDGRFYPYWRKRYFISRERWNDKHISTAGKSGKSREDLMAACADWERDLVAETDEKFKEIWVRARFFRGLRMSLVNLGRELGVMIPEPPQTFEEATRGMTPEEIKDAIKRSREAQG